MSKILRLFFSLLLKKKEIFNEKIIFASESDLIQLTVTLLFFLYNIYYPSAEIIDGNYHTTIKSFTLQF